MEREEKKVSGYTEIANEMACYIGDKLDEIREELGDKMALYVLFSFSTRMLSWALANAGCHSEESIDKYAVIGQIFFKAFENVKQYECAIHKGNDESH